MVYISTKDDENAYNNSTMNNDVHLQALIEKSLQLKPIQYKYPEHDSGALAREARLRSTMGK